MWKLARVGSKDNTIYGQNNKADLYTIKFVLGVCGQNMGNFPTHSLTTGNELCVATQQIHLEGFLSPWKQQSSWSFLVVAA